MNLWRYFCNCEFSSSSDMSVLEHIREASVATFKSRYVPASLLYVVYSIGVYETNYISTARIENKAFVIFGVLHLFDAFLYAWAWRNKTWRDTVLFPEYLNIIGAVLYLYTSTLYGSADDIKFNRIFYVVRYIELVASIIEVFAALGWIMCWYLEFNEKYGNLSHPPSGRGFTLRDPDFHANWTIFVAAIIYLIYNVQVTVSIETYSSNNLYIHGDIIYLINSVLYMISALRDLGWFWFIKIPSGQYSFEYNSKISEKFEFENMNTNCYNCWSLLQKNSCVSLVTNRLLKALNWSDNPSSFIGSVDMADTSMVTYLDDLAPLVGHHNEVNRRNGSSPSAEEGREQTEYTSRSFQKYSLSSKYIAGNNSDGPSASQGLELDALMHASHDDDKVL